jgi:methylenetetrahydrofolate reductase (NADPH)
MSRFQSGSVAIGEALLLPTANFILRRGEDQMNAPNFISKAVSASMENPLGAFLRKAEIEITPKQIEKLPLLANNLPAGTKVFIALIDPAEVEMQITATGALKQAGFEPVPHVPARFVRDKDDLKIRMAAFGKLGVTNILALGGGAPQPIGKFDAALQLMETGVFEQSGITRIGIAGHPEGNPDITKHLGEDALFEALKLKQSWLHENNFEGYIATQFLFDAGPLALWASNLRDAGINLPLSIGVPGPASIKTLVKYAAMCGVGNSARFIRKQALNITKLLTVSEPTEFCDQLATLHFDKPELNIAAPHFYPFGGFDKLFDWLGPKRA